MPKRILSALFLFFLPVIAFASVLGIQQGGTALQFPLTGFKAGTCLTGNGLGAVGTTTCSSGGSGSVSTSTHEVANQVATFSSNSATPALIGGSANFTFDGTANRLTATYASTTAVTAGVFFGALTGNSSTATALAANGTNCSAGSYALGVDASGNSEGCTVDNAGGGAGSWFVTDTNYNLSVNSTSTLPIFFKAGVMSSTTNNHFAQLSIDSGSNSASAFQVNNATGQSVLSVDDTAAMGSFSIGSSTPYARFTLAAIGTDAGSTTLFLISSSTQTATTTLFQISNTGVASTTNLTDSGVPNALLLTTSGGIVGAYGGAGACTNQFVTAISGVGATTCASINNGQWSGTQLSFGNGGTNATSFTANTIPYVNNAATALVGGVATSSPTFNGCLTTTGTAGYIIGGSAFTVNCANNGVTVGMLAQAAANTILGNATGATANITAFATSSLFTATLGQVIYASGTGALVGTSSLFIAANGSIGIGSTTPNGSLSVGNGIASSSIRVAEYDYGATGNIATSTAMTLGPSTANQILWPIGTSATTLTLCGFQAGDHLIVQVVNPNAAPGALTWAACAGTKLYWAGNAAPTPTATANFWDTYSFTARNDTGSTTAPLIIISGAASTGF